MRCRLEDQLKKSSILRDSIRTSIEMYLRIPAGEVSREIDFFHAIEYLLEGLPNYDAMRRGGDDDSMALHRRMAYIYERFWHRYGPPWESS